MRPDLPEPTDRAECNRQLSDAYSSKVCSDSKVMGKLNDYINGLTPDNVHTKIPWGDVVFAASKLAQSKIDPKGESGIVVSYGDPYEHDETLYGQKKTDRRTSDPDKARSVFDLTDSDLTDSDWERMKAICTYCAKDAVRQERVIRFREVCLSGRTLTKEQYLQVVSSPGLGFFTISELRDNGVSLTSASKVVDGHEEADGSCCYTIRFSDPDITITKVMQSKDFAVNVIGSGQGINVSRVHNSVLRWLELLGDALAEDFKWHKIDTYIFLVTGIVPASFQLERSFSNIILHSPGWPSGLESPPIRGLIGLQVPYWLAPAQVAAMYSNISFRMQGRQKNEQGHYKQPGRPLDSKSIRLFRFVEEQREKLELPASRFGWSNAQKKKIFDDWNQRCNADERKIDRYQEVKRLMADYARSTQYRKQLTGWTQEERESSERLWREAACENVKPKLLLEADKTLVEALEKIGVSCVIGEQIELSTEGLIFGGNGP